MLLAIFPVILILFGIWRIQVYNAYWKHLVAMPGPKRYPIVGNLMDIMNPQPEEVYASDRRRAKVLTDIFSYWFCYLSFVGITNPEDTEKVLNNMKHIEKSKIYNLIHGWLGEGLLTSTGTKWQNRRKILTPAFHFSILQEFIIIFHRETTNLVKVLEKRCHDDYIDVIKPITEYTLSSIGETSMGFNFNEDPRWWQYKQAVYEFGDQLAYRLLKPWLKDEWAFKLSKVGKENVKTVENLHSFSRDVIRERKYKMEEKSYSDRKRLAMLDLLLKAKDDGADIDDEGIREEVDTFMFEGHDTTSMALCLVLFTLGNEPEIQEEVLEEINEVLGDPSKMPTYSDLGELKFMERCIKESLRLYPAVPFIARLCAEDFKTKDGYTIPKGTNIHLYINDLHRHPGVWENPDKFDPDRFLPDNIAQRHPYAYIPFSAGPRNCIGQKYAILEIKTALCGILRKFVLRSLDKPEDVKFKIDMVLRPVGEIRIKFIPRSSSHINY